MSRTRFAILAIAAALGASSFPAHAQSPEGAPPPPMPGYQGQWQGQWNGQSYEGEWKGAYAPQAPATYPMDAEAMRQWQARAERCRDYCPSSGVTGAVVGGVAGGIIGNSVADDDRALGTAAGAVAGAVTGAIVDKSIDASRRKDCEDFWAHAAPPMAYPGAAYAGGAYAMGYPASGGGYPGYGSAPHGYVWVPVMLPGKRKPCVETTTTTTTYVPVTTRRRTVPRHAPPHRQRTKTKRVYTGS